MRNTILATLAVAIGFSMASVPLSAHHGNAEFNTEKTVTVKGIVTEWFWVNPHCFLKFDENGQWRRETLGRGDEQSTGYGQQWLEQIFSQARGRSERDDASGQGPQAAHRPRRQSCIGEREGIRYGRRRHRGNNQVRQLNPRAVYAGKSAERTSASGVGEAS